VPWRYVSGGAYRAVRAGSLGPDRAASTQPAYFCLFGAFRN
jgi:hypothetical protein